MRPHPGLPAAAQAVWAQQGVDVRTYENPVAARLGLLVLLPQIDSQRLDNQLNNRQILGWEAGRQAIPGLGEALSDAGFVMSGPTTDVTTRAAITVGLVSAAAAIAQTGTIILLPDAGQPLLTALLPQRLVILLPYSRLHPDHTAWQAAWRAAGRLDDLASACLMTGSSFSLDIELHEHRGVFGPRSLHILLYNDGE